MKFYEKTGRSIFKAITYKILIVVANSTIIYTLTGNVDLTVNVLILTTIVSVVLYYLHERLWNKVHWGKSH